MAIVRSGAPAAARTRRLIYDGCSVLLTGLSLALLGLLPVKAEPPTEQVQLRNEQTNQGLSLRLEQRQLRLPDEAPERQEAEQRLQQERLHQYQLHQRQQADSAVLRQRQRVEPLPTPESGVAKRTQRQLHQQQDAGQRLQFRLNRR